MHDQSHGYLLGGPVWPIRATAAARGTHAAIRHDGAADRRGTRAECGKRAEHARPAKSAELAELAELAETAESAGRTDRASLPSPRRIAQLPTAHTRLFRQEITRGTAPSGRRPELRPTFGTMQPFQQIPHPRESPKRVVSA
ncbi:hypothetical protein [Burkholderia vietnamiensis]|uniref:hypothetical protein n=1 Tax=Burkholderia vietnamiensis TaxID=60552 RepID=UPI0012D9D2B6|nr:hypothetical protein [Burkholderia vietnamiensis]HDR9251341.1 hypothetical protein [Burkholderia vietnamiensis]